MMNDQQLATIYPNPSSGRFDITLHENYRQVSCHVYNYSGSLIKTGAFSGTNSTLDLCNVGKGVYLLKIIGEKIELTQKIIIE